MRSREGFAELLVRWRYPLLAIAIVLGVAAIGPAHRLKFDQSIESMYAPDSPYLLDYRESKRIFGGDEIVLVAFTDDELFTPAGKLSDPASARLSSLADSLAQVPGVDAESVQSLAEVFRIDRFPLPSRQREVLRALYEGILLGADRRTTAVLVRLVPRDRSPVTRAETILRIRETAARFSLPTHVVGEPVLVHDTYRYLEQDGRVLGWFSTGLLILVIGLIFRRLRWVLLPVLVVEIALLWTKACLVVTGSQLSMVSSMLNSLLMVVGIATVMHVIVRFREYRQRLDAPSAARATIAELWPPIFWTTATTAAGFAAQMTSHVAPVRSFGFMMAFGTMVLFGAATLVIPAGLLVGRTATEPDRGRRGSWVVRLLNRLSDTLERYPRGVGIATLLMTLFAVAGFWGLQVETDFSKNFRPSAPVVQALDFAETRLGGASVWEVNFPAPDRLDATFLRRVNELAERLRVIQAQPDRKLTKVVALTDGLDLIPLLPVTGKLALLRTFQPRFESTLYRPESNRMRIILRASERQRSEDRQQLIADVRAEAQAVFPEAEVTGLFVLLTFLIDSLLSDQWISFAAGASMIVLLMSIAFRSLRVGLISLAPNLLPILFVIGAMGWLGLSINLGTAMIASVSLGLTVDSSIHYFAGFYRARREGADSLTAVRMTNQGVGTALTYTNLALIAGFLALTWSHFMPLVYFGLLVSAAMVGGLIGNLMLLPLLIRAFRL